MIMLIRFLVLAVCFSFASVGFAGADEGKSESPDYMEPYTGSAEFERIKSLEGKWEGTSIMHGKEVPVSVIYKTTSGGSVVVETLFPDTPHEMVSVYFEDGGKVEMVHYCMLKNQPRLELKKVDGDKLIFDYVGGTNLDEKKDQHMHSLIFTINDKDSMVQEWTPYDKGKPMEEHTAMTLTRVQ